MELKLADLSKENPKYLRKDIDGGILTEKYEIDRYKAEQYADVVDNLMLGNYNEFGEYELEEDIALELIACEKIIEDNYENILFVKSSIKVNVFSNINFAVKIIDSNQEGYKVAILELLEPIYKAKGFIENTQATTLKKLTLPYNDIFKQEVYHAFNIVVNASNEGAKREENDDDFQNVINRKIKLLYIKQKMQAMEYYEVAYKKNVEELNKTEKGKKVLQDYKKDEEVAQKYLNVEKDDYKSKNELLVKNIERHFPVMPEPISNTLFDLNKNIAGRITDILNKINPHKNRVKPNERIKPNERRKPIARRQEPKAQTNLNGFINTMER